MPLFEPYRPDDESVLDRGVVVRPAHVVEVPAIEAVARTRGTRAEDLGARIAGWIGDGDRTVLVAAHEEDVVGWAMLARWAGHDDVPDGWYVSALTVHPQWRRRRIGERLMAGLLTWPRASSSAVRSVVNAGNLPSLVLHRRSGFEEARRAPTLAGITFVGGTGVLLVAGPRDGECG